MSESQDKVDRLRSAIKHPTKDDLDYLDELDSRIAKSEKYKSFLEHPITKEVVTTLIGWVKDENEMLLSGEGDEINAMRRDLIMNVLDIFSPHKAKQPVDIVYLDSKIKEFEDWYKE